MEPNRVRATRCSRFAFLGGLPDYSCPRTALRQHCGTRTEERVHKECVSCSHDVGVAGTFNSFEQSPGTERGRRADASNGRQTILIPENRQKTHILRVGGPGYGRDNLTGQLRSEGRALMQDVDTRGHGHLLSTLVGSGCQWCPSGRLRRDEFKGQTALVCEECGTPALRLFD